ncbi:unnamed protein product [Cochlearia groenlandica]
MTRKSPPHPQLPSSRRGGVVWLGWKLIMSFSVALCLLALLRIQLQYGSVKTTTTLGRISAVARSENSGENPKIAFLFLTRRDLPLDFLWDGFFTGIDHANFSIYIHSLPGFVFNEDTTRSKYFYGRQVNNSIKVIWGESSMIAAERLLLSSALEDISNQRFLLLSDSCVPLYEFGYIYRYIISSPRSFVDSFVHTTETRYSEKMSPVIPEEKWRKGSQWVSLIRSHAEVIVNDDIVFPVFEKLCKRCPPIGTKEAWLFLQQGRRNCIPDEHYVQTLLKMRGLESEIDRRTLTYTVWNVSGTKYQAKSWHPVTFTSENTGPAQINQIKNIDHVNYESESRTEWCKAGSKPVPCYLFARKFTKEAALRIMSQGLMGSSANITL